jgi:hypothetical protein
MNTETLRILVAKGLSPQDILEVAEAMDQPKGRSANAERQARHRARVKACDNESVTQGVTSNVTRYVTPPLSLPPNENISNPPTHTPPDKTPARKGLAKPEDVTAKVWDDFLAHRKAKRAPVSETVIAGMRREAGKAGWTLDAALAECVFRGWQAIKADWLKEPAQTAQAIDHNPLMASLRSKQLQAFSP